MKHRFTDKIKNKEENPTLLNDLNFEMVEINYDKEKKEKFIKKYLNDLQKSEEKIKLFQTIGHISILFFLILFLMTQSDFFNEFES